MKNISLKPIVRALDNNRTINRAGILINNNNNNNLVIQLVNLSLETILLEQNAEWAFSIPASNSSNAPHILTTETRNYSYKIELKDTNGNSKSTSDMNTSSTKNEFTITLASSAVKVNPLDYIEITVSNFKTNLSPRTGFIQFKYTKARNYQDGTIFIPVMIQPMTMTGHSVEAYFGDNRVELSNQGILLYKDEYNFLKLGNHNNTPIIQLKNSQNHGVKLEAKSDSGLLTLINNNKNRLSLAAFSSGGNLDIYDHNNTRFFRVGNDNNIPTLQISNNQNHSVRLEAKSDSGLLTLMNNNKNRLSLAAFSSGGNLDMYDSDNTNFLKIGKLEKENKDQVPTIRLKNSLNHNVTLEANLTGGLLTLMNRGKDRLSAGAFQAGGFMSLRNANNRITDVVSLGVNSDSQAGYIHLYNKGGKKQMALLSENDNGVLQIFTSEDKKVAQLGTTSGAPNGYEYGHLNLYTNTEFSEKSRKIVALDGTNIEGNGGLWLYKRGEGRLAPIVRLVANIGSEILEINNKARKNILWIGTNNNEFKLGLYDDNGGSRLSLISQSNKGLLRVYKDNKSRDYGFDT